MKVEKNSSVLNDWAHFMIECEKIFLFLKQFFFLEYFESCYNVKLN